MSRRGNPAAWVLLAVLLAGLWHQTGRLASRLTAGLLLHRVELSTYEAVATGRLPVAVATSNLEDLERAARLDPIEVGIPLAHGSEYLLMRRPAEAIESYRRALAIEPRPEIYLNLGRAYALDGRLMEAQESFRTALRLDPSFFSQVPEGFR